MYPHSSDVDRSEFASIVLEKPLEGGIRELDPALPVKNEDA